MARKIDLDAVINRIRMAMQGSHPSSPDSGYDYLYIISGSPHGGLYLKDPSGRQIGPFITGSVASNGVTYNEADPYGIHHRISGSHADDDEFSSNTLSSYTQVTPTGNVAWVVSNHVLSCIFSSQTANDICSVLKSSALADGEFYETTLQIIQSTANTFGMVGIVVTDGTTTTSNGLAAIVYPDVPSNRVTIEIRTGTLTNMSTSAQSKNIAPASLSEKMKIRLKRDSSTSFSYLISTIDGAQFSTLGTSGVNPGFTPTHAGIFTSTWGGSADGIASFDYFRHY